MLLRSIDLLCAALRRLNTRAAYVTIFSAFTILLFSMGAIPHTLYAQSDDPAPASTPLPENVVRTVQTLNSTVAEELDEGELLRLKRGTIQQIIYAPNGQTLAVATNIGVWLYDVDGSNARFMADLSPVWSIAWSPDSSLLAAGAIDGVVRVWRAADGVLLQELAGHTEQVRAVAWSPDGTQIASASDDGTVAIWSQGVADFERTVLNGHTTPITFLTWSPDGSQLYSASNDGSVRVWQIREPAPVPAAAPATEPEDASTAAGGTSSASESAVSDSDANAATGPPLVPAVPAVTAGILVNRLRVREGPGTDFADFARVSEPDEVQLTGQVDNCTWVRILTNDGVVGWVSGQARFVNINGSCSDVREVDPATEPLLPTPAPTATPRPQPTPTPPLQNVSEALGCYLFQNQLNANLSIIFNAQDREWQESIDLDSLSELEYCLEPGTYTYTISAPAPWTDINGELPVNAGDKFLFPIRGE